LLRIDAEATLSELNVQRVEELGRLEQTGIGNPPVHVTVRGVSHGRPLQRIGAERKHAKLWLTDGKVTRDAVMWGVGNGSLPVGRFDLAAVPQLNEYNGRVSVQFKVLDWREA
jgi:single-stranded-DNA-specific exonuclease